MTPTPEALKLAERLENVIDCARSGKQLQRFFNGAWSDCSIPITQYGYDWLVIDFRIKPEPRRVPYDRDSFPWPRKQVLVRWKGMENWYAIIGINNLAVFVGSDNVSYSKLSEEMELSLDNGATWQSADREVSE